MTTGVLVTRATPAGSCRADFTSILLSTKCLVPCEYFTCMREQRINPRNLWLPVSLGHCPPCHDLFHYFPADTKQVSPQPAANHSSHDTQPGSGFLEESHLAQCCGLRKGFRTQTMPSSLSLFPAPSFCLSLTLFFFYKGPEWRSSAGVVQGM